jgi:hypothetical protein
VLEFVVLRELQSLLDYGLEIIRYRQVHNEINKSLQVGYEFTCGKTG